jgi:hypothetical protein
MSASRPRRKSWIYKSSSSSSSNPATEGAASTAGEGHGQEAAGSSPAQRRGQTGKSLLRNFLGGVRFGSILGQTKKDAEGRACSSVHEQEELRGADRSVHATSRASLADTVVFPLPLEVDPAREHTFASEQDGQTFLEFIDAFKRDASDQVRAQMDAPLVDPHASCDDSAPRILRCEPERK